VGVEGGLAKGGNFRGGGRLLREFFFQRGYGSKTKVPSVAGGGGGGGGVD